MNKVEVLNYAEKYTTVMKSNNDCPFAEDCVIIIFKEDNKVLFIKESYIIDLANWIIVIRKICPLVYEKKDLEEYYNCNIDNNQRIFPGTDKCEICNKEFDRKEIIYITKEDITNIYCKNCYFCKDNYFAT